MEVVFVLNRPVVPENVGGAARAMAAMGWSILHLVNPCEHLVDRAKWLASSGEGVLKEARVFSSLEEAVSGCSLVVGTTASRRKTAHHALSPAELRTNLAGKSRSAKRVALVFGEEQNGLSTEELLLCNLVSRIEQQDTSAALNLAQAVMVYAYELSGDEALTADSSRDIADCAQISSLLGDVERVLDALLVAPQTNARQRIRERLALLSDEDLGLVHFLKKRLISRLEID